MSQRFLATTILLFVSVFSFSITPVQASWVENGVKLSADSNYSDDAPHITSDGSGGAIIVWQNLDAGTGADIHAQRIDEWGNILWATGGVTICSASANQLAPVICSDGSAGAIIAWEDYRGGGYSDIYAQRIDGDGNVLWTTDGVAICSATNRQDRLAIISDEAGGAIIGWRDYRNSNYDVYVQRIDGSGVVQWTADGVGACTETSPQSRPDMTTDGHHGVILVWDDYRNGNYDIYVQRIDSDGTVKWYTDGTIVCNAVNGQSGAQVTSDGMDGAIVVWRDYRSGTNNDIYAQRVMSYGGMGWTTNGVPVCTDTAMQDSPITASDDDGGAFIAWVDQRNSSYHVYAQRIDPLGNVQWTTDGLEIVLSSSSLGYLAMCPDGRGGASLAWTDSRNGSYPDVFTQTIDASGNARWADNGIAICEVPDYQSYPDIISDGAGGILACWKDQRNGQYRIYAQRIERNGYWGYPGPSIFDVRDVPGDEGGFVNLSWYPSRLDNWQDDKISHYTVWRAIPPTSSAYVLQSDAVILSDAGDLPPEGISQPVFRRESVGTTTYFWKLMSTVDAYHLDGYSEVVPTLFDSTSTSTAVHYFQVIAHSWNSSVYWKSPVDSTRSVDNLAPSTPAKLAGAMLTSPLGLSLSWERNPEADLLGYAVYRGTSEDFIPDVSNLLDAPSDTTLFDPEWTPSSGYYYKVSAWDIHENESGFATLAPDEATAVESPSLSHRNALYPNAPNPFNPRTLLVFEITEEGPVSLRVYDTAGRLIRELVNESLTAGRHEVVWDGRDSQGRPAASGAYFVQLKTTGFTQSRKLLLSK